METSSVAAVAPKERPINADLPASTPGEKPGAQAHPPAKAPAPKTSKRRRKPIPAALKAIAGLFLLAAVFIVAAILGGRGGGDEGSETPAPVIEAPSTPAEAPASRAPEELGYPAFATANTTRVGGPDAASNAAGVALATYPSTKPAQQPRAVTLVDADDWRSAIAASVLMAAPLGAPALVSEADGVPEPTTQALDALDPQGDKQTKGVQAFAIGTASARPT